MTKSTITILVLLFSCSFTKAQQWEWVQPLPVLGGISINDHYADGFFLDETKGWILTSKGVVYHTTDGGDTWHNRGNLFLSTARDSRLVFLDSLNGFVAYLGGGSRVWETKDGGNSWNLSQIYGVDSIVRMHSVAAYGNQLYLCYTDSFLISKVLVYNKVTNDTSVLLPPAGFSYYSYIPANDTLGYIATVNANGNYIGEQSANSVNPYKYLLLPREHRSLSRFSKLSDKEFYFASYYALGLTLYNSMAGSVNWIDRTIYTHNLPVIGLDYGIMVSTFDGWAKNSTAWVCIGTTKMYYTTDKGKTYNTIYEGLYTRRFIEDKNGFLYGLGRNVIRLDTRQIPLSDGDEISKATNEFNAHYNAFSSSVIITTPKSELGNSKVAMYDLTGRVVMQVDLQGGTTETLSTAALTSGIYIVEYIGSNTKQCRKIYINH